MIKCDPRVKAKCPFKNPCCGDEDGYYLDGSDCDRFARGVLAPPPTNADHIRSMTDQELADFLALFTMCDFCPADNENCPKNCCSMRLERWLKKPYKEDE